MRPSSAWTSAQNSGIVVEDEGRSISFAFSKTYPSRNNSAMTGGWVCSFTAGTHEVSSACEGMGGRGATRRAVQAASESATVNRLRLVDGLRGLSQLVLLVV